MRELERGQTAETDKLNISTILDSVKKNLRKKKKRKEIKKKDLHKIARCHFIVSSYFLIALRIFLKH